MNAFSLCLASAACVTVGAIAALAQDGPDYVEQDFGYDGCDVEWGPLYGDPSVEDMEELATEEASLGFTIHADGTFGKLLIGDFPPDCRAPKNLSWPLYLAEGHVRDYSEMDFGFDGCDVTFGPLMEDTDLDAMIISGRLANAVGFTFQEELHYGQLIVGQYPDGCESPKDMSWPLYLDTSGE